MQKGRTRWQPEMPTPLRSKGKREVESRCKIKVAGKFIQGKAGAHGPCGSSFRSQIHSSGT